MKKIEKAILEEISRFNNITNYIIEQEATLPPPPTSELPPPEGTTDLESAGMTELTTPEQEPPIPPTTGETQPEIVDIEKDPDVEKIGDKETDTKEIEVTDLVKSQKSIGEKQEEYFENLFAHLENLENKLGEMDNIMNKLNDLEIKVEKLRPKTPQEKLELRSLDSGPFNQKLSQFFEDKEDEMEKSGKNEYVLTQDEIEDYSPNEIKKTFRNFEDLEKTIENFKQVR